MKLARAQGAQESTSRAPGEPQESPRNRQRVWESPGGPQESPGKPQESRGEPRKVPGDPGEHQESRRRAPAQERSPGKLQERPGNMFRIEIIKLFQGFLSKLEDPKGLSTLVQGSGAPAIYLRASSAGIRDVG